VAVALLKKTRPIAGGGSFGAMSRRRAIGARSLTGETTFSKRPSGEKVPQALIPSSI
jgi:hypothetical protein